jgi:hypothetical protein
MPIIMARELVLRDVIASDTEECRKLVVWQGWARAGRFDDYKITAEKSEKSPEFWV